VLRLSDQERYYKYLTAATIAHAKSSRCSCCGHRVLNRVLSEVVEEDELLGWFVGDLLCADCVGRGALVVIVLRIGLLTAGLDLGLDLDWDAERQLRQAYC
jgi:hypothetical protein